MKTIIAFLVGLALGVALVVAAIFYNPWAANNDLVPLKEDSSALTLRFAGHVGGALVHLNSGLERLPQVPADAERLWHSTHKGNHVLLHVLENSAGEIAGYGVKMAAWSEDSRVLPPRALVASNWNVVVPGLGSFFVAQNENYWPLLREVILPATQQGEWKGSFAGDLTVGPRGTLEGEFTGASGVLRGQRGVARESVSAQQYTLDSQHTAGDLEHALTIVIESELSSAPDIDAPAELTANER